MLFGRSAYIRTFRSPSSKPAATAQCTLQQVIWQDETLTTGAYQEHHACSATWNVTAAHLTSAQAIYSAGGLKTMPASTGSRTVVSNSAAQQEVHTFLYC
jgi:hypothetical protein